MERIALVTKEFALLESAIVPPTSIGDMDFSVFHEMEQFLGDPSNWWIPTVANFLSTVRAAGFPQSSLVTIYDQQRAIIRADKGPRTAAKLRNEDISISIDSPQPQTVQTGEIEIAGWTVSQLHANQAETRVYAYLDTLDNPATELGMANYPLPRPDIAPPYGERYTTSGFRLLWTPPAHVRGQHTLHLFVDAPHGWNFRSVPIVIGASETDVSVDAVTPSVGSTIKRLTIELSFLARAKRVDQNLLFRVLKRVGLLP